jgi:cation transport ATPase
MPQARKTAPPRPGPASRLLIHKQKKGNKNKKIREKLQGALVSLHSKKQASKRPGCKKKETNKKKKKKSGQERKRGIFAAIRNSKKKKEKKKKKKKSQAQTKKKKKKPLHGQQKKKHHQWGIFIIYCYFLFFPRFPPGFSFPIVLFPLSHFLFFPSATFRGSQFSCSSSTIDLLLENAAQERRDQDR